MKREIKLNRHGLPILDDLASFDTRESRGGRVVGNRSSRKDGEVSDCRWCGERLTFRFREERWFALEDNGDRHICPNKSRAIAERRGRRREEKEWKTPRSS